MITTCTTCGQCYEAGSEEQANEPTRFCPACRRMGVAGHTPWPWNANPPTAQNPGRATVTALSGSVTIYDAPLTAETAANARLIAASLDMMAACRAALEVLREYREAIFSSNQINGVVRDAAERAALDRIDVVILLVASAVADLHGTEPDPDAAQAAGEREAAAMADGIDEERERSEAASSMGEVAAAIREMRQGISADAAKTPGLTSAPEDVVDPRDVPLVALGPDSTDRTAASRTSMNGGAA